MVRHGDLQRRIKASGPSWAFIDGDLRGKALPEAFRPEILLGDSTS